MSTGASVSSALLDLDEPLRQAEGASAALAIMSETLSSPEREPYGYLSDALVSHLRDVRAGWHRLRKLTDERA